MYFFTADWGHQSGTSKYFQEKLDFMREGFNKIIIYLSKYSSSIECSNKIKQKKFPTEYVAAAQDVAVA